MLCTPLYPMVLLIIIPMKNGYFIGKINPTFSDKQTHMYLSKYHLFYSFLTCKQRKGLCKALERPTRISFFCYAYNIHLNNFERHFNIADIVPHVFTFGVYFQKKLFASASTSISMSMLLHRVIFNHNEST